MRTMIMKEAASFLVPYRCDICNGYSDIEKGTGHLDSLYRRVYSGERGFHICSRCLLGIVPKNCDKRWFTCLSNPLDEDEYNDLTLFMPFEYSGVVDKALPKVKFDNRREIARLFGILLGEIIRQEGIKADLIVPVPLSEQRFKERGFNQAEEMAYPVSVICSIPMGRDVLLRTRNTGRQSEIRDTTMRAVNMSGAFEINGEWDITGLRILLIDDVATTGNTLRECAVELYGNGASDVLCCAFSGNRQLKNDEPF